MKITKTIIVFFYFLAFAVTNANAQDAVITSGGDASGSNGSASYSVGQVIYTSVNGASGSTNQGVQQPYQITVIGKNPNTEIGLSFSLYPNPAHSFIYLNMGSMNLQNLSFQLFDALGQILSNQTITTNQTLISMFEYSAGNYYLRVFDDNSELKAFKIIKY